ncbi:unnamed protein product [Adineta steineri]|uniref:RNA-dependent RNA polymerase n=1 Tax=Adineta steineri TaxID=433720 RepID=A0A814GJY1_9BILA|nr:unnamed protein product [Adineta steineri]
MTDENMLCRTWSKNVFNDYSSFNSQYALAILHSLGEVFNKMYLKNENLRKLMIESAERDDKRFYKLAAQAYYNFKKKKSFNLEKIFESKNYHTKTVYSQNKQNSYHIGVVHITSNSIQIMPRTWTDGNRVLRHPMINDINDFCLVDLESNFEKWSTKNCDYIKNVFVSGIEIGNRRYYFIGSSNSQLKKKSYWFVKADSLDDVHQKRKQLVDFDEINNLGKYIARVGLWFSSSMSTGITLTYVENTSEEFDRRIQKGEKCVTVIDDIKYDEYCFTDGNGLISNDLARLIAKTLKCLVQTSEGEIYPSAYQIRMAGCKGLIVVDPDSKPSEFYVKIRPSMKKFSCNEWVLDINNYSRPIPTRLNNQIILLLSDLGVPDSTFFELQTRWFAQKQKFLPNKNDLLKNKIPLPANECRLLFGCALESDLKPNQCFIRYQLLDSDEKPLKVPKFQTVTGQVIVTKNPCPYAGDMIVLEAVDLPKLHCLRDVIVFSTKGNRPVCNQIGGSDLDGDQYFVYWGTELQLLRKVEPLDYKSPPATHLSTPKSISPLDFINHCLSMLSTSVHGQVFNLHQIVVDKNEEKCEQRTCQKLAKEMANMFSIAIDSGKTGCSIDQTRLREIQKLVGSTYPDYLMGKKSYQSQSILGKLYRNALEFTKKRSSDSTVKVLQNGVNCNVCGRICKNERGLRTHKRSCDKKKKETESKISSTIIPQAEHMKTPATPTLKFRIIDRLMKNPDGEYNCPNAQCGKTFKPQGITPHVKSCAKEWLKQNGFSVD